MDYAVVYRIHASIIIQEAQSSCAFTIEDLVVGDKLEAIIDCDNDKYIELSANKIAP